VLRWVSLLAQFSRFLSGLSWLNLLPELAKLVLKALKNIRSFEVV
jgi:hypothetical protein